MRKKYLFFLVLSLFFFTSCSYQSHSINSLKISGPKPENYIRPITERINNIDFRKELLPLGEFGGTLNLSIFGSGPKTFNPWASTDATSSEISSLMFDSLFDTDPVTGEITPKLAKDYQVLDGGKKIIVELRDGIKWSDGKEITSDDVVFTWNEIIFSGIEGGGFNALCLIDGKYPSVKKIDNKKIEFKTDIVFSPFLRQIGYAPAPKHIIEKIIKNKNKEEARKNLMQFWGADVDPTTLVTSGPFKLLRYKKGERVELIKNSNYYVINSENKKLPYLEKIIYSIVQDKSFELFKFLANELDVIDVRGEDLALMKKLKYKKKFELVNLGPTSSSEFLILNLSSRKSIQETWFNETKFRQAISHAINRKAIVDNVLAGVGKPLFTPESLGSIFLNKKISSGYSQDLNYSKMLLEACGFKWDSSNNLIDKKNNKVEFTVFTNAENLNRQAIGVIIQDDLKKIGIKLNLRPIDFNTLVGKSDTGDWDAIILGLTGGFFEPNSGANVWRLTGRLHLFDNKPHDPRKWEVEIDKIFNDATKVVEFEKRKKLYDRFQEIVYEELPFIYLTSPLRIISYQNSLQNIIPTIYGGVIYNIETIYKSDV